MQQINQFGQFLGDRIDNWTACQRPKKRILQGQYGILEPMNIAKHSCMLYDALTFDNQGESWTYLPYGPFATLKEFQGWLVTLIKNKDTLLYAIINAQTKQVIGMVSYINIRPEHGVIEIGDVHFSTLLKRTPLATEAIYLLLHQMFEELQYRRCEWKCNSLNKASQYAAERFGFKFEGIFRQHYVFKSRNRDTAWFSILDSEWDGLKKKFEKWLNSNNFDSLGHQITRLSEI
jgi:RimJ/RimL family protein N-acetyltransferase